MSVLIPNHVGTQRYIIDPVAFFFALLAAPLIIAIAGCFLIVPVFALFLGGPAYLLIGTPVLLLYLRRHPGSAAGCAGLALATMAALISCGVIYGLWHPDDQIFPVLALYGGFGVLFAPLWAALFGALYQKLRRGMFALPQPL